MSSSIPNPLRAIPRTVLQLLRSAARKNERLARVPIVVVAAERSRLVPPDIRMLDKPCDFDELVRLARKACAAIGVRTTL